VRIGLDRLCSAVAIDARVSRRIVGHGGPHASVRDFFIQMNEQGSVIALRSIYLSGQVVAAKPLDDGAPRSRATHSQRQHYSLLAGAWMAASTCAAAREPDAIAACMHGLHARSVCSPAKNTRMPTGLTNASRDPAAPTCAHPRCAQVASDGAYAHPGCKSRDIDPA
jgi:hypothetical protein